MSSLIKRNLLRSVDANEEYLIDPASESRAHRRRLRRVKDASPEETARLLIAQAEDEAANLISAAMDEGESIRASAYREGYEAGFKQLDAERQALEELAAQIEADAWRQVDQFWTSIEPELLKLSVDIARKIVRRSIDENDEFVLTTVKEGLRQLRDRQDLKIRVNPADYDLLREHREDITSSCDGIRSIEIIDDRRIDKGGCVIESGNGHLDARIETQLGEVERALLEAVQYGKSEVPAEP